LNFRVPENLDEIEELCSLMGESDEFCGSVIMSSDDVGRVVCDDGVTGACVTHRYLGAVAPTHFPAWSDLSEPPTGQRMFEAGRPSPALSESQRVKKPSSPPVVRRHGDKKARMSEEGK
jgi:hypothetical protein